MAVAQVVVVPTLTYKPSDLLPVTKMTTSLLVLAVNPASPIKSVPDLIAAAKKVPGKLDYGAQPILDALATRLQMEKAMDEAHHKMS